MGYEICPLEIAVSNCLCCVWGFFHVEVRRRIYLPTALSPWDSSSLMDVEHLCEALKSHEDETALDAEEGDCDYPCSCSFLLTPLQFAITIYNKIYMV